MAKDLIHAHEAMQILGVDEHALQSLVAHGELRAHRHKGSMAFRRGEVVRLKSERTSATGGDVLLDPAEAMSILGVDERGLQTLVTHGDLRALRDNGAMKFRRADVEAFIAKSASRGQQLIAPFKKVKDNLKHGAIDFGYEATNAQGTTVFGQMAAASAEEVEQQLRACGLSPSKVTRLPEHDDKVISSPPKVTRIPARTDALLTAEQVMSKLGINKEELRVLVSHGALRAYRHDDTMKFRLADLHAWQEKKRKQAKAAPEDELLVFDDEIIIEDDAEAKRPQGESLAFAYEAMDAQGAEVSGTITAESAAEVERQLRARNLFPTKIARVPPGALRRFYYLAETPQNTLESGILMAVNTNAAYEILERRDLAVEDLTELAAGEKPPDTEITRALSFTRSSREAIWAGAGGVALGVLLLFAASFAGDSQSVIPVWVSLGGAGILTMLLSLPFLLWRVGVTFERKPAKFATFWLGPGFPLFKRGNDLGAFDAVSIEEDAETPGFQYRLRFTGANNAELTLPLPHSAGDNLQADTETAQRIAHLLRLEFKTTAPLPAEPSGTLGAEASARERALPKVKDGRA